MLTHMLELESCRSLSRFSRSRSGTLFFLERSSGLARLDTASVSKTAGLRATNLFG